MVQLKVGTLEYLKKLSGLKEIYTGRECMKREVDKWVQGCDVCQISKSEHVVSPGLLQPLPVPMRVWSQITMDFIEGRLKDFQESI